MVDFYTNFAKNGNPNGNNGDTWKPYTTASPEFMILDADADKAVLKMSATPQYKGSSLRR